MHPSMAPEPSDTEVFRDLRTGRSEVFVERVNKERHRKFGRMEEAARIDLKRTNTKTVRKLQYTHTHMHSHVRHVLCSMR